MRRITILVAVALCASCAFAAPAFAKEKVVFGEFVASVAGQTLSHSTPGVLKLTKEGEVTINRLQFGGKPLGPFVTEEVENPETKKIERKNHQDIEHPCEKVKVSGLVEHERSSSLTFDLKFIHCVDPLLEYSTGTVYNQKMATFTLPITVTSNYSAALGIYESDMKIEKTAITISPALKKCSITIPAQTIPFKMVGEKEYEEIVEFSNESEEPEHWEHSKKLKELYPSGEKEFLGVEFEEKFKHIRSYQYQGGECTNLKGPEEGKIVTEGEYTGDREFTTGVLSGSIEYLEIKDGDLKFQEP